MISKLPVFTGKIERAHTVSPGSFSQRRGLETRLGINIPVGHGEGPESRGTVDIVPHPGMTTLASRE